MSNERPDVIEVLEGERKYYIEQLRRINVALATLKGEKDFVPEVQQSSSKAIPWTAEVMKIFEQADTPLNLKQVRQRLAEEGIGEALNKKHQSTIYSTLMRGVKNENLEKVGHGLYRKKTVLKFRRTESPTEEGTEPIEKG